MTVAEPNAESATARLHRLSSYSPELEWDQPLPDPAVVQGFVSTDLDHPPEFVKQYAEPRVPLPRDWPHPPTPVLDLLAGNAAAPPVTDVASLARLLYLSCGITRTMTTRRGGQRPLRAAGSAGGLFPLETYVAVPDGHALPPGVHWYDPREHALVLVAPPPRGEAPALVVTGVPWRTGWRYRERGFRHIYWDAGTMLSHVLALAAPAQLYPQFPDATVTELVGADGQTEFPVAVVGLGPGTPALEPAGTARTGQLDAEPIVFGLVTDAQRAGEQDRLGAPWPTGAPVAGLSGGAPVDDAMLARTSHRRLDPHHSLARADLTAALSAALRGVDVTHWVVANAVDGVAPGVYRWPDLDHPVRPGEQRAELFRIGLDQGLPRDASAVVISTADPATLDDAGYRAAQLGAGLVGGRLHLIAPALGAGANGMTFLDSEIAGLLGVEHWCLLWTCVGVPEYRARPGGMPGQAPEISMVIPR